MNVLLIAALVALALRPSGSGAASPRAPGPVSPPPPGEPPPPAGDGPGLFDFARSAKDTWDKVPESIREKLPLDVVKRIPAVLPVAIAGGAMGLAASYAVAQILNWPGWDLGGVAYRSTVDTVNFAPGALHPVAEARMLSEGYDYDQDVQLEAVQDVAQMVFVVRPGKERYLRLSEDGAGLSRYAPRVDPAGELRTRDQVAAIMGDRYEGGI